MQKLQQKVESAVEYWVDALQLGHWELKVEYGEIEEAAAEVKPTSMYDDAKLKFDLKKLEGKSDSFIERTVIHELLHLHDRDRSTLLAEIETNLNPEVFKLLDRVNYQLTEGFIDRVATFLYNQRHSTK